MLGHLAACCHLQRQYNAPVLAQMDSHFGVGSKQVQTEDLGDSNGSRQPGNELTRLSSIGGTKLEVLGEEYDGLDAPDSRDRLPLCDGERSLRCFEERLW